MKLAYNQRLCRMGVMGGDGKWIQEGIHCGQTFRVKVHGRWVQTRMEYCQLGWYLVGLPGISLHGLPLKLDE